MTARRWLQVRLLYLLVLAGVIPLVAGTYVSFQIREYYEHRGLLNGEEWRVLGVTAGCDEYGTVVIILSAPWTRRHTGNEDDDPIANDELMNRMAITPTIRTLIIDGGRSNDVTIMRLVSLRGRCNLRSIVLAGTHVTEAGVASLRQAFPECDIQFVSTDSGTGGREVP